MKLSKNQGFTIVELLIVIVVIAILAAISIVAYNGIQDRAKASQAQSAAVSWVKGLRLYMVDNGTFPLSVTGDDVACIDGTTSCHSGANATKSAALKSAMDDVIGSAPSLPYGDTLVNSNGGRWYFLFSVPLSQECPATVASASPYNTTTSSTRRTCRYWLTN